MVQREDRLQQDPAALEVRRLVPDDGHGQGPKVQDARGRGGGAGPGEGRRGQDRLTTPKRGEERLSLSIKPIDIPEREPRLRRSRTRDEREPPHETASGFPLILYCKLSYGN